MVSSKESLHAYVQVRFIPTFPSRTSLGAAGGTLPQQHRSHPPVHCSSHPSDGTATLMVTHLFEETERLIGIECSETSSSCPLLGRSQYSLVEWILL